jgi:GAF domain-containing protein
VNEAEKSQIYDEILAEVRYHIGKSANPTARMATIVALLASRLKHFFWTGFYVLLDGELTVGPYQGPPACIVLPPHKGVCWAGIDRGEPVLVPNVHDFPGHIVCDGRANSELVLPLHDRLGRIIGVLDVDSADFDAFDLIDVDRLQRVLAMIFAEIRPSVLPPP